MNHLNMILLQLWFCCQHFLELNIKAHVMMKLIIEYIHCFSKRIFHLILNHNFVSESNFEPQIAIFLWVVKISFLKHVSKKKLWFPSTLI